MKTKTLLIILAILAVTVFLASELFWCSGECETIECTPNNPCTVDGKRYAQGEICANEGAVCDDGYIWDCHCKTRIIGAGPANFRPTCGCD